MRFLILTLAFPALMYSQGLPSELYITSGQRLNVDSTYTSWRSFSTSSQFPTKNPLFTGEVGDSINFWLYNIDTVSHSFEIAGITSNYAVAPNDSVNVVGILGSSGIFRYLDPSVDEQSYLGLSGMLVVNPAAKSFYWNLREYDRFWSDSIVNGGTVNWLSYEPDYFTINGVSSPNINGDALARITGHVGDSIHLYIANNGLGIHSLHFHGYHCHIVHSSKYPGHTGWIKDTFPVYPSETLHLLLVPHQPGEFPVHDHNLIGVSGNNVYPFGMFTTLLIVP